MTSISSKLLLVATVISTLSCKKQTDDQIHVPTSGTPDLTISGVKQSMSQQMTGQVYDDLDWSNAVISSFDEEHKNNLMQVRSRTSLKTSLYYSVLNNVTSAYLVTLNLPNKTEKETDIDGFVEVRSVKNQLLTKFMVENDSIVAIEKYNNEGFVDPPDTTVDQCAGCTLPPVVVYGYIDGGSASYFSMFYTYGGGLGSFIQTTPGSYGSGGSNSNQYYDKYNFKNDPTARQNIFLDKNPSYAGQYYPVQITKYPAYTQYTVVDKKTFWCYNVELSFQSDLNNHMVVDKTSIYLAGITPGSYIMKTPQNPAPEYRSGAMFFQIDGAYSYGVGSFNMPVYINVKGIGTSDIRASFAYGNAPIP